jgi:hypothetical protein
MEILRVVATDAPKIQKKTHLHRQTCLSLSSLSFIPHRNHADSPTDPRPHLRDRYRLYP